MRQTALPAVLLLAACQLRNSEPEVMSISGPSRGGFDTAYTFMAVATDPDNDEVSVRFSWMDGDTSEWSDWVPSGESAAMSHAWNYADVFLVKAQAKDRHGHTSRFGPHQAKEVTIANIGWNIGIGVAYDGAVAVAQDGTILISAADGFFYCLNPDASIRWSADVGGARSDPVVAEDGTVYVGSDTGLWAVSAEGQEQWHYPGPDTNWTVVSVALGRDSTVYAVAGDGVLCAVRPDGSEKWVFDAGAHLGSVIAIGPGGDVYIVSPDKWLAAVGPDGALKWQFPAPRNITPPAIGADGTLYFGLNTSLCAVDGNGTELWRYWAWTDVGPPVIGPGGAVYFGAGDMVYALDSQGALLWSDRTDYVTGQPAVGSDSLLYVPTGRGLVYAYQPDGQVKWHVWFARGGCGNITVGKDGVLYVPTSAGRLYTLYIKGSFSEAVWPMRGHDAQHTGRAR